MDIHKPKVAHSWREFLIEIGTIICGILIALGLEQVVEWVHWREQVSTAREALSFDLKRSIGTAAAQDSHTVCTARRLHEIEGALNTAAATGRTVPLGWNGPPPGGSWRLRSWSALNSGQVLTHFPNRELILLSNLQDMLERIQEARRSELEDWATLRTLAGPSRRITDAELALVRVALAHAYQDALRMRVLARQAETLAVESHILNPSEVEAAFKEGIALNATSFVCQPLPPISAGISDNPKVDLTSPPARPGETQITTPGIGHAVTLER